MANRKISKIETKRPGKGADDVFRPTEREKMTFSLDEVNRIEKEIDDLAEEERILKKRLVYVQGAKAELKSALRDMSREGLVYVRAPYGSIRDGIVEVLDRYPEGLPVSGIINELRGRIPGSIHPRTPNSVLTRLKALGVVRREGRRWVLANR